MRHKTKKPAAIVSPQALLVQLFRANRLSGRGKLVAVEVEPQFLRLTGLQRDRLFLGNRAAAAIQLDANRVAVPGLAAGESGRAEDTGLAAGLGRIASEIDLGISRHMDRQRSLELVASREVERNIRRFAGPEVNLLYLFDRAAVANHFGPHFIG